MLFAVCRLSARHSRSQIPMLSSSRINTASDAPPHESGGVLTIGKCCKFNARPEHVGPGMWHSLHVLAEIVDTLPPESQAAGRQVFVQNALRGIGLHMPCLHCRHHAIEHMTEKDPVRVLLEKTTPSCLEWSHRFHTVVGLRLGRALDQMPSLIELREFLASLRDGKGCSGCGGGSSVSQAADEEDEDGFIERQILAL